MPTASRSMAPCAATANGCQQENAEIVTAFELSRRARLAAPVAEGCLPVLLTPEQLAEVVFQIEHDEKHLAHLRRHGGLPYVQFQLNGRRIFRYPRGAVLKWIAGRTHGSESMETRPAPSRRFPKHTQPRSRG